MEIALELWTIAMSSNKTQRNKNTAKKEQKKSTHKNGKIGACKIEDSMPYMPDFVR